MTQTPESDLSDLPLEVDVQSVKETLDNNGCVLLDCRETMEFETAKIESATLIPMNEIPNRLDELEPYRDQQVVVFCHAGMRSFQVASWLRQQGFKKSQSMAGGIDAWSQQIDPSVPRY